MMMRVMVMLLLPMERTCVGVAPHSPVSVPDSPCDNQGDEGQEDSDGEPSRQLDNGEIEKGGGRF